VEVSSCALRQAQGPEEGCRIREALRVPFDRLRDRRKDAGFVGVFRVPFDRLRNRRRALRDRRGCGRFTTFRRLEG